MLNQRDAEGPHGGVLFNRVAQRHNSGASQAMGTRCPAHQLAVVTARSADDFLGQSAARLERFKMRQLAANLERADWCGVFVLDPAVSAQAP